MRPIRMPAFLLPCPASQIACTPRKNPFLIMPGLFDPDAHAIQKLLLFDVDFL